MFAGKTLHSVLSSRLKLPLLGALLICGLAFGAIPTLAADGDAAIAGTVTNSQGRSLAGISVVPYRLDDGEFIELDLESRRTDFAGTYRLGPLAAGTYRIHFVDNNYILNTDENPNPDTGLVYVSEFYNDAADVAAAADITVGIGQEQTGIDGELVRAIPAGPEGEAEVTNCTTFGSVGEAGTLADALATANVINFACSGSNGAPEIIVPEIPVTSDLTLNGTEGVSLSGDGANRVMRVFPGIEVEVNDLTMANGSGYTFGGAVYNIGRLTLNRSIVQNSGTSEGGGIYNVGVLSLQDSSISRNGGTVAGAISNVGEVVAFNTQINQNNANSPGAITNRGTMSFTGCLVEGNNSNSAHVIENFATLIFEDCIIQDNTVSPILSASTATLEIRKSIIRNNGGGMRGTISSSGTLIMVDSVVSNNRDYDIIGSDGTADITNVTISGNTGRGASLNNRGTMHVRNSTVTNNTVIESNEDNPAGGVGNSGTLHMSNTIVANQASVADCGGGGTFTSEGYNLDSDGSCALTQPTDISNGTANLGPLWDNGPSTGSGQATLTHALLEGSDALDAGDCSGGTVTTDQRGVSRPQGAACDIGAFELSEDDTTPESPDGEALIALYNSTDGDNWTDNTNWLEGDHCTWYGVTCEGSQVVELKLGHNQLNGSIPPELGNLVNVRNLDLNFNQLSGAVPPELGNLPNVQTLTLHVNQLNGAIPPELGNLSTLVNLLLNENQLSGTIPPEMGNLTNLEQLYLGSNQLGGTIPPELGNLSNLLFVEMENNQLSGPIPPEIGGLSQLATLALRSNQFSGPVPLELGDLSSLSDLYLNDNAPDLCMPFELQGFVDSLTGYGPPPGDYCEQEPLDTNLIKNSSFEFGEDSAAGDPAHWRRDAFKPSAEFTWDADHAHSGSRSAKISASIPNDARWIQTVDVEPNRDYLLSGWIKTEGVQLSEQQVDAGANLSVMEEPFFRYTEGLFETNDWAYVSIVVNSGENSQLTVAARLGFFSGVTVGTAWFDDISLTPISLALEQEAEMGELSGSFAIGSDEAASGSAYIHVPEGFGNRGAALDPAHKVRHTFDVTDAGIYRIKGWVYAPDIFNNSFYVQVNGAPSQGIIWHTRINSSYASEYVTDGNGADVLRLDLSAGEHTIDIFLREDGTRLDKLALELIAPQPEQPKPEGCEGLEREGEGGELFGNFGIGSDSAASGGNYAHVAEGFGNRGGNLDPMEKASYCFTVAEAGTYRIKGWVYARDLYNNSFYLQVNGAPTDGYLWHTQVNTEYAPEYVTHRNGIDVVEVELAAGEHTIDIFLREDGTRLDKLALVPISAVQSASALDISAMAVRPEGSQWLHGSLTLAEPSMSWQDLDTAILSEAQVTLTNIEDNKMRRSTGIDLDGGYYFDNVPSGRYELTVALPSGYQAIDGNLVVEIKTDGMVALSHDVEQGTVDELDVQIFLPLVD